MFAEHVENDTWDGDTYTQAWLDANTTISGFSGDRAANQDVVEMHDGAMWSEDEFAEYGRVVDGENWPADDEIERRACAADPAQTELPDYYGRALYTVERVA
jgi:hypothetical protein